MPATVKCFIETKSLLECQTVLNSLLETYRSDFPKYATKSPYKYLQMCFEKVPNLITSNFKYSHISGEVRSDNIKSALEQLGWAGLIHRIVSTSASASPLYFHAKENKFKLLFLDIGLVCAASKLDLQTVWNSDLLLINAGSQAEQFVGQEILAYADPHTNSPLFYWDRDKKGSMAEVDYVIQAGSQIIPIEVKAGTTGSLRSLHQFLSEKNGKLGVRISEHPLSFHGNVFSAALSH